MAKTAQAPSGPALVRTKLHPPVARAGLPRPGAVARLRRVPAARLSLVRAPAGAGKTTLLAEWADAAGEERRFAWLALDPADDEPRRFWTYVVAALATAVPELGGRPAELLTVAQAALQDVVLPELIDELAQAPMPVVLVLDDYHVVHDARIHASLAYLIEHAPPELEVAISSRTEPPLPVARIRARGELAEVDALELRFTREEAGALLNGLLALGLEDADVQRLWERTEGWAAGLYLAALSLRGRASASAFVADFAGDDRHVVDYLAEEVLADLPGELRAFLVRTSILARFSAPLCDAVLQRRDSAEVLAGLERSNLLLIPLDERRQWYRYHHLFADLLALELGRDEAADPAALHARAAAWHRAEGHVDEAIGHAMAAGLVDDAAEMVARHWSPYLQGGEPATTLRWLQALPEERVLADARLCLARAVAEMATGHPEGTTYWIEAARGAPVPGPFYDGTTSVESGLAARRCMLAMNTGDFAAAEPEAALAADLEAEGSPWRGVALAVQGISRCWHGDFAGARPLLELAIEVTRRVGMQVFPIIYGLGHLALMACEDGDAGQAAALARASVDAAEHGGTREHWTVCLGHAVLARAATELTAAERLAAAERGVALAQRGAGPHPQAYAQMALAERRAAVGDGAGGRAALSRARALVAGAPEPTAILPAMLGRAEPASGRPAPAAAEELSERELAVLRLLPTGLSQRDIGHELYVSRNTVKSHVSSIFRKLGVGDREQAITRARRLGLL
ncbi:MAG TPA: LuxR C-terminal-related transcriptional regulator [Solirubrobacteraceae bacterium]|nr:LuxR C-terminal-related transcriptional regulator [Solirubrobacteraceae bacterium]